MKSKSLSLNLVLKKKGSSGALQSVSGPPQESARYLYPDTSETLPVSVRRARYQRAAETVADECQLIDPHWLLESHPLLWERLAALDHELTEMERSGADEQAYSLSLETLTAYVQKAKALYEQERSAQAVQ